MTKSYVEICEEGRVAYFQGVGFFDGPYPKHTPEEHEWMTGWYQGEAEAQQANGIKGA